MEYSDIRDNFNLRHFIDDIYNDVIQKHEKEMKMNNYNFQPYNIYINKQGDFVFELIVVGFKENEIDVRRKGQFIIIECDKNNSNSNVNVDNKCDNDVNKCDNDLIDGEKVEWINKGFSTSYIRHILKITNDNYGKIDTPTLKDGILKITLRKNNESLKIQSL